MDPADPPSTEGPITLADESYEGDRCTKGTFRRAVVSKTCRFFYRFDPMAETDAENDYGIWWFQTRYRPRSGWCLRGADVTVTMPEGFKASAWSTKSLRVERKRTTRARLESKAADNSTEVARVVQRFVLRRGRYVNRWDQEGAFMRLRWTGRATRRIVAFAGGFEGSWPATEGPQAYTLSGGPTYVRC